MLICALTKHISQEKSGGIRLSSTDSEKDYEYIQQHCKKKKNFTNTHLTYASLPCKVITEIKMRQFKKGVTQ